MKTQLFIKSISLCLIILAVNSCTKDLSEMSTISYKNDLIPILETSCSGNYCHATINHFSIYENIKEVADNDILWEKIIVERSMPPVSGEEGNISEEQRMQFATWIEEGALNN